MNERIRELAEQAENYAHEQNDKFGLSYKREYDKKFAELIVRECGKWVNDNVGLLDEEASADLLKHFGVE